MSCNNPIILNTSTSTPADDLQTERLYMKTYSSLQLRPLQTQQLAARWHSWCRRRAALSHKLASALHALQQHLPSKLILPMHLIHPFTSDAENPVQQQLDPLTHACVTHTPNEAAPGARGKETCGLNACEKVLDLSDPSESIASESTEWVPFWVQPDIASHEGGCSENASEASVEVIMEASMESEGATEGARRFSQDHQRAQAQYDPLNDAASCASCSGGGLSVGRDSLFSDEPDPRSRGCNDPPRLAGLFGESGKATTEVQRVLKDIEEVHQSDALMFFEIMWPFCELDEVCSLSLPWAHCTEMSIASSPQRMKLEGG